METCQRPYVYTASKRRHRSVRVFRINRIVAVVLLFTIALSGIIVYFSIKRNDSYGIGEKSFYYLQMGEFTSSAAALSKSLEIKNSGGCGYIINDGIFRVMAAVYSSKDDAKLVENKLTSKNTDCSVYEVKSPKFRLSKYDDKQESDKIKSLIFYPTGTFFNELQKLDIALDSKETTDSTTLLAVSNIKDEMQKGYDEIVKLLSKHPTDKLLDATEKTYKQILQAFQSYFSVPNLIDNTSIKSILCTAVEAYISNFQNAL